MSQFHPELEQHVKRFCNYIGQVLNCPVRYPQLVDGFFIAEIDATSLMGDILFERPEARISPRIPLILAGSEDFDGEGIRTLSNAIGHFNPRQSIVLLVLLSREEDISPTRRRLIGKMRAGYGTDVVVMGRRDLEATLDGLDPPHELRSFFLSQIDIARISPYNVKGPVSSDLVFSGREDELRTISGRIRMNSYIIMGGRRIGKTSILLRLHHIRLPAAGLRTLFHDCSITPSNEAFLAADIRDWQPEPPSGVSVTFGNLLQSPPIDKPLVLLLDEADKLVAFDRPAGWPLLSALRALANTGRAQFVLSGERTLREALQDSSGPLFNFANEMLVGRLDYRSVDELVTRPMSQMEIELVNEADIVRRIYDFTSGHPNVVQRLCHRLIERLNEQGVRQITLNDVNAVMEDPKFQEVDFLQTYWEATTPLERMITLVLSHEARTYRLKEVRQLLSAQARTQPSATATKEALDRLVDLRSILKRSQAGYSFAVEAFPQVLANTTTVEDLLEVLVEQYQEEEARA